MTINTDQLDQMGCLFADCFNLAQQPVRYVYKTSLAFCSREPCRVFARQLVVNQPVSLCYDVSNRRIAVAADQDCAAGYLYAQDAAFLAILLDYLRRQLTDQGKVLLRDNSIIHSVVKQPDPHRPETRRMRYPKVGLTINLALCHAWPLFTVLTVLHLKDETLPACADPILNPWLQPLIDLRSDYCQQPYDTFQLPELLSKAWLALTAGWQEAG